MRREFEKNIPDGPRFISTRGGGEPVSIRQAVIDGQAPDGGLYVPTGLPRFTPEFFSSLPDLSFPDISFEVARAFFKGVISDKKTREIVDQAFDFEIPL